MLPVSGMTLVVRQPTGLDELFVVESDLPTLLAAVELARRVATAVDGSRLDWTALPAADLEAATLLIRRAWLGDAMHTEAICAAPDCRAPIDVSFSIGRYMAHHRPRRPRGAVSARDGGWYILEGADLRFRVPSVGDLLEAMTTDSPALALSERCVKGDLSGPLARRVSRVLDALAPRLESRIGGTCPECGHAVAFDFDPTSYVVRELREVFAWIHSDMHTLAYAYGWSEEAILALPRGRRRHYATLIENERMAA